MVLFISPIFYLLPTIGFTSSNLFILKQIINNTVEAPFGILGASTEPENNFRVKLIVESDTGFLLEIDRYYCD